MSGGLMQLVARGAQDIYLSGNPVITYFKAVYRRHTNFAMESIMQNFNKPVGWGESLSCLIGRNGDLISGMHLQVKLPDITCTGDTYEQQCWTDNVGHHLIKEIWIEIGGQKIDHHYSDWLEVWSQLTVPAGKMKGYLEMIGQDPQTPLAMNTGLQRDVGNSNTIKGRYIFIPFQFWFCRHIGLALPMICLQYHEVKINLTLRKFSDVFIHNNHDPRLINPVKTVPLPEERLTDVTLWVDYIYLDTDERRRFAQVAHEYLIEQVQYAGDYSVAPGQNNVVVDLNFNHPVKELVWFSRFSECTNVSDKSSANQWCNFTTTPATTHTSLGTNIINRYPNPEGNILTFKLGDIGNIDTLDENSNPTNLTSFTSHSHTRPAGALNQIESATITLNGNERVDNREGYYFNWIQCYKHHTNIPNSPGINVYSFALHPEEHQPSGSCNFSRLIDAKLHLKLRSGKTLPQGLNFFESARNVYVYALNYNILRIMSGMAGLAYSE